MHANSAGSGNASMKPNLNMGGNLKKIDEIFVRVPPKNKRKVGVIIMYESSSEEEDNIKNRNDGANVHVTGLLKNSACWRSGRRDNIDKPKNLLGPASLIERNLWNLDVVSNHYSNPTSSDFEYIYGYYDYLGQNIRRTSSDQENFDAYAKKK